MADTMKLEQAERLVAQLKTNSQRELISKFFQAEEQRKQKETEIQALKAKAEETAEDTLNQGKKSAYSKRQRENEALNRAKTEMSEALTIYRKVESSLSEFTRPKHQLNIDYDSLERLREILEEAQANFLLKTLEGNNSAYARASNVKQLGSEILQKIEDYHQTKINASFALRIIKWAYIIGGCTFGVRLITTLTFSFDISSVGVGEFFELLDDSLDGKITPWVLFWPILVIGLLIIVHKKCKKWKLRSVRGFLLFTLGWLGIGMGWFLFPSLTILIDGILKRPFPELETLYTWAIFGFIAGAITGWIKGLIKHNRKRLLWIPILVSVTILSACFVLPQGIAAMKRMWATNITPQMPKKVWVYDRTARRYRWQKVIVDSTYSDKLVIRRRDDNVIDGLYCAFYSRQILKGTKVNLVPETPGIVGIGYIFDKILDQRGKIQEFFIFSQEKG